MIQMSAQLTFLFVVLFLLFLIATIYVCCDNTRQEENYISQHINNTDRYISYVSYATKTSTSYRIIFPKELTSGFKDRVYGVDIAININDNLLTDNPNLSITRDIESAQTIREHRLFIYDTTWNPHVLPQIAEPIQLGTGSTLVIQADEETNNDMIITINARPQGYLVGSITVQLTSVYPKNQSPIGFRIERIDHISEDTKIYV